MGGADELVDIIDDDGEVIGTVTRREMRARRLRHRGVAILVVNPAGEVLIHRRSDDKDVWPGQWDIAAGGVVRAGETFEEGARRELAEELGIVGAPLELLGEADYVSPAVNSLARYYRATWDGPVTVDRDEIADARWVTPAELHRRLDEDLFVPESREIADTFIG